MLKNKNYFVELTELKEQRSFRQPRDCYDVKKLDPLSPSCVYKILPLAFMPSGQCFKRCTAKDNADVTRSLLANGCIHACM